MKRSVPFLAIALAILLLAFVPAAEAQFRLGSPDRIALVKPQVVKSPPATETTKPDPRKMVSILQGRSAPVNQQAAVKGGGGSGGRPAISPPTLAKPPAPVVVERRTKIAPQAAPKGIRPGGFGGLGGPMEIRRGKLPADGGPAPAPGPGDTSTKTLYLKKGNTPAEGDAPSPPKPPYPTAVKAGRIPAESDPVTPRPRPSGPSGSSGSHLVSSGGGSSSRYGGSSGLHSASIRPAPQPTELSYRVDASSRLSTDTVKFVKGSVELADQASYDYLFALAEALRSPELGSDRFVVEGHASSDGSDYSNLLLSQRRANAIFDFLASRGVDSGRLLAVGHGESQARFAEYEPEFLRAQDRQVIVYKLAD